MGTWQRPVLARPRGVGRVLVAVLCGALLLTAVEKGSPASAQATDPKAPTAWEQAGRLFGGPAFERDPLHERRARQLEHYAEGRLQEMRRRGCPTTGYGAAMKALAALDGHLAKMEQDWADAARHDRAALGAIAAKAAVLAGKITVGFGSIAIAAGVLPSLTAGALLPEALIVQMGGIQNIATFSSLFLTLTEYGRSMYDIVVNSSTADVWKAMSDFNKRFVDAMKNLNAFQGFYGDAMKNFLGVGWATLKVALDGLNAWLNPMDDFARLYEARNDWQDRMSADGFLYSQLLRRLDDAYGAMIASDRECESTTSTTTPPPTTTPPCVPDNGRPCAVRPPDDGDTVIVRVVVKVPGSVGLEFRFCDGLTCGNPENADCVSNLWIPQFAAQLPPRIVLTAPPGMRLEKLFMKGQDDAGTTNHYGYYDASATGDWNRGILDRRPTEGPDGTVVVDLQGSGIVNRGLADVRRADGTVCGLTDDQKAAFESKYGSTFKTPDTTYLVTAIWGRRGAGHADPGGTTRDTTVPVDRRRDRISSF